ncbi:MAG: tryptophan--tRNA ligase [Thermoguttaceae bacterium]|jgi:tryptophanyl-tRNA synthetase|nr:tryptophan--tRNA ligase [Thermoguttaceae bacterium]MBQ3350513.1 tryptophan--tRNA ligase [Thermoguttaceae bacterium]MBR5160274.1 tryptophan--tRNA ligase [Thermoguttaceae bacterium]MBR5709679.1 tryptophan--tRNA ligase [Thermoguttaceae bacterium]MBR6436674.1 tryptophan--tRNA ligase [Thermoguttaceae bacterium]
MRVLSGIQPTGKIHWGNYFGAIRQFINLQSTPDQAYYFVANLHALTTIRDKAVLEENTLGVVLDFLALGLDPNKATLFVQSEVPEVSQLCWLLLTVTPMGLLERCHAYKEKKANGLTADAGLFNYPILMAADIIIYDSDLVPVGEDQLQHIEVARDVAARFNHLFGETFVLPKGYVLDNSAKVPGTDGQKMSKSYNNTIQVFEEQKQLRKKIMRIQTDSRPMEEPKNPDECPLFQLYQLFGDEQGIAELREIYAKGGFGYGMVKGLVADAAEKVFGPARERRAEWASKPKEVREILDAGAANARKKAKEVLLRAQENCGIFPPK